MGPSSAWRLDPCHSHSALLNGLRNETVPNRNRMCYRLTSRRSESLWFSNMQGEILHPIEASSIQARRERVFLLIAGIFLGSLAMLNILGVSRFIALLSLVPADGGYKWNWGAFGPDGSIVFALAVGVLPYPITFLCTDIISEFYGRKRANWVVFIGFIINVWVILILWVGGLMPPAPQVDDKGRPAVVVDLRSEKSREQGIGPVAQKAIETKAGGDQQRQAELERINSQYEASIPPDYAFYSIRALAFGAVFASMVAYFAAQFCDVYLFHFWKKITQGRHLWLRNNGSTLISQLVDTIAVILITYYVAADVMPVDQTESILPQLMLLIATGYVFKLLVALADTIPFYLSVRFLKHYLRFDPVKETALTEADRS